MLENQLKSFTKNYYKTKPKQGNLSLEKEQSAVFAEIPNFEGQIHEKYLNSMKKNEENLMTISHLKHKINELESFNKDLLNNNYQASYKYMLIRIEELNVRNDELRNRLTAQTGEIDGFNKFLSELKIENENLRSQRTVKLLIMC